MYTAYTQFKDHKGLIFAIVKSPLRILWACSDVLLSYLKYQPKRVCWLRSMSYISLIAG